MRTTYTLHIVEAKMAQIRERATRMKVMAAGKAKNAFGLLMDTARAEPVIVEKHGRAVAVVISVEEYERLKGRAGEPVNAGATLKKS